MKTCIRCQRTEQLEDHHIIQRVCGGGDEPENREWRCRPCHKYEHARRSILCMLEGEVRRGQGDRIQVLALRLKVLDRLNTVRQIRKRGTYLSYWLYSATHRLPSKVRTREEAAKVKATDEWFRQIRLGSKG